MKKKHYLVTNVIFNAVKEYESLKEIRGELGFTYGLMEKMLNLGLEKHGYVIDEINNIRIDKETKDGR